MFASWSGELVGGFVLTSALVFACCVAGGCWWYYVGWRHGVREEAARVPRQWRIRIVRWFLTWRRVR
jgi:hypothetical protein